MSSESPYFVRAGDGDIFDAYDKSPVKEEEIAPVYAMPVTNEDGEKSIIQVPTYLSNIGKRPHKTLPVITERGKKKKCKTIQTDFTPRQIASRNLQNLLRSKHRCGHTCFVLKQKGRDLKHCWCVANFARRLREEEQQTSTKAVADKWIPILEEYAWTLVEIHKAPSDINSLFAWLEVAHPFCLDSKQNSNVDWMVDMSGEKIHFCLSSVWEFKGFLQGRKDTHTFMKTFILSESFKNNTKGNKKKKKKSTPADADSEEETPNYFRDIVLPKANKREVFRWCREKCIKTGRICVFASRELQKEKNDGVQIKEYYAEMKKDGLVLNNQDEPMDFEDEQRTHKVWRPVVALIHRWDAENFLVIAHPNMVPEKSGEVATVVFKLHEKPVTATVAHVGNGGTALLTFYCPDLRQLSHDGFRNGKFYQSSFPVATNESVVLQSNLGLQPTNALQSLAAYLLGEAYSNQESLDGCFEHIVSCCRCLIPEDKRPSPDAKVWSEANVLLSTRKDYQNTKDHFAQAPFSINERILTNLQAKSIVSYVVTIPLTEDGCWLHVFPNGFADNNNQHETGKMVYVPFGTMFLQPITVVHGGGFRTSFNGNRRIQMLLHFVPTEVPDDQVTAILAQPMEKKYFASSDLSHASYQLNKKDGLFHKFCTEFGY